MRLDPAVATVLAALVTAIGAVLVARATSASKRREAELAEAQAAQTRRDADWRYLEASRDTAIEDAHRWAARAHQAEAHLAICVAALRLAGAEVPAPPIPRTE